jgi:aldose 1-epimerase
MSVSTAAGLVVANANGASATFSAFGARLVALRVPDRNGRLDNVTLGFDTDAEYRRHANLYFGATIGRVAGRISGSAFSLGGRRYELTANEGPNHVHGGTRRSLDRVEWSAQRVETERGSGVSFEYVSPHLEEGYPGILTVRSEYVLSDHNVLWTVLTAVSDDPTPVNLTNHAYWNLAGAGSGPVLDHVLDIAASRRVAMTDDLLPTGELAPVDGTALDFRGGRRIGERLPEEEPEPWPGFDSALVLDEGADVAVRLWDPASGRALDIVTSEPSIQLYTANRLTQIAGRDGRTYRAGGAICLEPQRMPDAVNRPEFPSIVLAAGDEFRHVSCYRFYTR